MFRSYIATLALVFVMVSLSACSNMWSPFNNGDTWQAPVEQGGQEDQGGVIARTVNATGEEKRVAVTMTGGGEVGLKSMDANDKLKMSRALDAATGKTTTWTNGRTGIKYAVTPIRKVVIANNPFCRSYEATAEKGSYSKAMNGTACVMTDGSWHTINH